MYSANNPFQKPFSYLGIINQSLHCGAETDIDNPISLLLKTWFFDHLKKLETLGTAQTVISNTLSMPQTDQLNIKYESPQC